MSFLDHLRALLQRAAAPVAEGATPAHEATPGAATAGDRPSREARQLEELRELLHRYILEREAAEEALAESEARYRSLIERAAIGIYRSTPEGRFIEVNPALVQMLGYESAEALCAVDVARDVYADPEERARLVAATRAAEPPPGWVVARWRCRDGAVLAVRVAVRAVRDRAGRLVELEGVVEDVTSRLRNEELVRRSERMASLGTLLAGVAHEINNPLAAVSGFAQLLLRGDLAPEDRTAVETISHEAARAGKIVRDLLTFARQEERDRRDPVRLNEVARHVVAAQRYAMETRGVRCVSTLDPANPVVSGDRAQLEQVVLNLVVNARQALEELGDEGGADAAALRIEVTTRVTDCLAIIEVSDSGPGIPPEALPRIFDPFFTTKGEGRGTGLGLSVVHGIVTEHQGTIEVDSEPGRGTRFTITLPRDRAHEEEADAAAPADGEAAEPLDILLVDDEEAILGFLGRYLASRGHAVVPTTSGLEALRLATNAAFDVVICDLRMPDLDGGELVRRLRALPGGAATRVVVATGEAQTSALRARASAMGADAVIEKPYDIEVLRRAVERGRPAARA